MSTKTGMLDLPLEEEENMCIGNYFRCYINNYYNAISQEIVCKTSFIRLKRKSCKGECATDKARPLYEGFEEDIGEGFNILKLPKDLEHGAIYKLIFVPLYTDPETGYLDEWEWRLVKTCG